MKVAGRWVSHAHTFLGWILALILLGSVSAAPRASAHSAANSPSSNFVSSLDSVHPAMPGATLLVIEAGSRLELTWHSGPEVLVLGYEGEPYLRVGPSGVLQNTRSPSVAVNRDRMGTRADSDADSSAPPRWKRISTSHFVRWHDHRIHYMGAGVPDSLRGRTGTRTVIQPWDVNLTVAGLKVVAHGTLTWVPGPSPIPWLGLATLVALLLIATATMAKTAAARNRLRPLVSAATLSLVAVDAIHLTGIAFGIKGPVGGGIGRLVRVGYVSVAGWIMGLIAVWQYLHRRDDALYLSTFAAGLIFVVGGLADLPILWRTSVAFAWPTWLARVCVALTLALGAGIATAGVLLTRPQAPDSATEVQVPAPAD